MKSLEPRTDVLLRAARHADDPTDDQVLRVRHSLMAKIAVGGATGGSGGGLALKLSLLPMAVKVSLSVAVLGLGALGGWKWATSASAHHAPTAFSPAAAEAVLPSAMPQPEPSTRASPSDDRRESPVPLPARAAPRPSSRQPAISGPELQEEARLLAEVQTALGAGKGQQALDKLKDYDQRFAGGVLRAEADAARVFALCQSGRRADAQAAARRFLRKYPSSPSASRVQQACAGEGARSDPP
jgi:hypothetical protein